VDIRYSARYKKDVKTCQKRRCNMDKLKELIKLILAGGDFLPKHKNHRLSGEWSGCHDVHIEPDWILIYEVADDTLILWRTGTHSDLF
jgi:mRNA interferase YafQ